MLMRLPILLLLASSGSPALAAPTVDEQISAIRKQYEAAGELQSDPEHPKGEASLSVVLPGSGPQTTKLQFVYAEHRRDEDQTYPDYVLRKVLSSHNVAAGSYEAEFLYDGAKPQLVFVFAQGPELAQRVYWAQGKPIRLKTSPSAHSSDPDGPSEQVSGDLQQAHLDLASDLAERGAAHAELFEKLLRSRQLEQ